MPRKKTETKEPDLASIGYEVKVRIAGLAPVLQNRFTPEIKGADIKIEDRAYQDDVGSYMPANNIRMMLIGNQRRRSASAILGSDIESGKGALYVAFCKACVFVESMDSNNPTKIYFEPARKTYDAVDSRSYQNKAGGRNMIERPMINLPWSMTFKVVVLDETIAKAKVKELFIVAGMRCGLGDYGPTFGRFRIVEWEELN